MKSTLMIPSLLLPPLLLGFKVLMTGLFPPYGHIIKGEIESFPINPNLYGLILVIEGYVSSLGLTIQAFYYFPGLSFPSYHHIKRVLVRCLPNNTE